MTERNLKIMMVCHDTGSANAISALAKNWECSEDTLLPVSAGPAREVFKREKILPVASFSDDIKASDAESLLNAYCPDVILTGTSLDAMTERLFIRKAYERDIFCLSFIDWWTNFGIRFSTPRTNDLYYLPDVVAVSDETAMEGCISEGIPEDRLLITGNPYWERLLAEKSDDNGEEARTNIRKLLGVSEEDIFVLIISGVIRHLNASLGFDEKDFWRYITPLPEETKNGQRIRWVIKKHPRESNQDFQEMVNEYAPEVSVIGNFSPTDALLAADCVFGTVSSMLLEAALLKKRVVSLQPNVKKGKLQFLRIFQQLGIPTLTNEQEIRNILNQLVSLEIPIPNILNLPAPIRRGESLCIIADALHSGKRQRNENGEKRL
ncbi:hypothetical protein [Desulfonema magnum]|uniref:Uncharacterized protein n=1 Tax=Desulfonema magnum TaxID=45655 RepID=A0A975BLH4_9BACT|nr:hypothetical protein [Desulfonema magnum]QTA87904.1 Uncharacterized protein dnm_039440 [Desulfonema magnum]